MYSNVTSCAIVGVDPRPVRIEASVGGGRALFIIVGLPDAAVRESKERVRSALRQQGFRFPQGRLVVNLSPADLPKVGATYDLPIALSVIAATAEPPVDFDQFVSVGELSLQGEVRPVRASLGAAIVAQNESKACLVSDRTTSAFPESAEVVGVSTLRDAVDVARGAQRIRPIPPIVDGSDLTHDLSFVRGQVGPRRALEVAAAGGHHVLFKGSPGAGKSMLARAMPTIVPQLTESEESQVALIWAAAGIERRNPFVPPFRSPHHSASLPSMVGGGVGVPNPGEVSKAHNGILFLDELGEFAPTTLDALRQPLEEGAVTIARSADVIRFPARFQVVAATNPCPCGFLEDRRKPCTCTDARKEKYSSRLSGPLIDRFDLRIDVPRMAVTDLDGPRGETSETVRSRVHAARARQLARGSLNRDLTGSRLDQVALSDSARDRLTEAADTAGLTGRGWDRVRRVARTVADLDGSDVVSTSHIDEAVELRGAA